MRILIVIAVLMVLNGCAHYLISENGVYTLDGTPVGYTMGGVDDK